MGWRYVKDALADPIQNYLNSTFVNGQPLKARINYIVLCKGIPLKVRSIPYSWAASTRRQASVSALLCLINQPNPMNNFLQLYNSSYTAHLNPYFGVDPNITMDYRFKSNHYVNSGGWYTQYLVSRLDGTFYATVFGLIERLADPNYSGEKTWIIDDDPDPWWHHFDLVHQNLDGLGFSLNPEVFVISQDWITEDPNEIVGYVSHGVHAGMPWYYILSLLQFDYVNGANFLSWESFYCWSFGVEESGHGQLSHFIYKGGSGGSGHVYEPYTTGATREYNTFPAYAMGYSIVDAHFQGIYLNAWQNCVVGDPLTAIAWGKQTLTQNLIWSEKNLVTGEISIPVPYTTLTINDNSYIEMRGQGFIPCEVGYGRLMVGQDVIFESDSWDRALFLSYDSENARLVWAPHPTFPTISYNVYRKINEGNWELIANTMNKEYIDEEVFFTCYECPINAIVYYKVTAVSQLEESDYSNEVSAEVLAKVHKEQTNDQTNGKIFEYALNQNYPNPFNPITTILYSIKEQGLVQLIIYDILGNEISTMVNEVKLPGNYDVKFNSGNFPSGIYFYKLTSGSFTETKKMIVIK